jgi:hypothetical protein
MVRSLRMRRRREDRLGPRGHPILFQVTGSGRGRPMARLLWPYAAAMSPESAPRPPSGSHGAPRAGRAPRRGEGESRRGRQALRPSLDSNNPGPRGRWRCGWQAQARSRPRSHGSRSARRRRAGVRGPRPGFFHVATRKGKLPAAEANGYVADGRSTFPPCATGEPALVRRRPCPGYLRAGGEPGPDGTRSPLSPRPGAAL